MEGWGWQSVHDPLRLPEVLGRWIKVIATASPFEMEFSLKGADGHFKCFLTRVILVRDKAGTLICWFGTNTDTDSQKRTELALSDAVNSRDEVLSVASHELKTPITSLKLQLQMAQKRLLNDNIVLPGEGPKLKKSIEISIVRVNRLTELMKLGEVVKVDVDPT